MNEDLAERICRALIVHAFENDEGAEKLIMAYKSNIASMLPRASGVPEAEAVAWQPHAYREQAKALNDKLMRDGMLRVGSPVDTILAFAESVWMEGFSEGCREPPPVAAPSGEGQEINRFGLVKAITAYDRYWENNDDASEALQCAIEAYLAFTRTAPTIPIASEPEGAKP